MTAEEKDIPVIVDRAKISTIDMYRLNHIHNTEGVCIKNRSGVFCETPKDQALGTLEPGDIFNVVQYYCDVNEECTAFLPVERHEIGPFLYQGGAVGSPGYGVAPGQYGERLHYLSYETTVRVYPTMADALAVAK